MEPIQELLAQPSEDFAKHLKLSDNHRIIFSGMYGIGKTTFLKHFFSKENDKGSKYNTVHLFPVNYQVSDSKDIFEYVKYDIIAHLLSVKEIAFEKNDIPAFQTIPYLLLQRPSDMLAPLLHFFGGAGKAYDNYKKLIDEVCNQHEQVQKDERKSLENFINEAKNRAGSIYENDFYTELINELLRKWKDSTSEQESVLIIDDLDRIDPQHAFRLFNIFSAHFDHRDEQQNKFGFDKVIFVCDIENIRNIFASNYGADVDFGGYIDKFFSKEVYRFDNLESLEKVVKKWIIEMPSSHLYTPASNPFDQEKYIELLKDHLRVILLIMLRANAINLRSLLKLPNMSSNYKKEWLRINGKDVPRNMFFIVILFDALVLLMGSPADLKIACKKCEGKLEHHFRKVSVQHQNMIESVLALLGYDNGKSEVKIKDIAEYNLRLKYLVKHDSVKELWAEISARESLNGNSTDRLPDPFFMYQEALQMLIETGYY